MHLRRESAVRKRLRRRPADACRRSPVQPQKRSYSAASCRDDNLKALVKLNCILLDAPSDLSFTISPDRHLDGAPVASSTSPETMSIGSKLASLTRDETKKVRKRLADGDDADAEQSSFVADRPSKYKFDHVGNFFSARPQPHRSRDGYERWTPLAAPRRQESRPSSTTSSTMAFAEFSESFVARHCGDRDIESWKRTQQTGVHSSKGRMNIIVLYD